MDCVKGDSSRYNIEEGLALDRRHWRAAIDKKAWPPMRSYQDDDDDLINLCILSFFFFHFKSLVFRNIDEWKP